MNVGKVVNAAAFKFKYTYSVLLLASSVQIMSNTSIYSFLE